VRDGSKVSTTGLPRTRRWLSAWIAATALACSGSDSPGNGAGGPAGAGTGLGAGGGAGASGAGGAGALATSGGTGGGASGGGASGGGASGSGGAGGGAAGVMTRVEACTFYFDTICDRLVECGAFAREDCALRSEVCPDRLFAEGSGWTIERAVQCAGEWANFDCDSVSRLRVPECAKLPGSLDDGAPCIAPDQCTSGSCDSHFIYTGECGTCLPVVTAGAACNPTVACPSGQHCDDAAGSCVDSAPLTPFTPGPKAALGQTCIASSLCEDGLACQGSGPDAPEGLCVAAPPLGSPCLYDLDGIGQCAVGATCPSPESSTCQALSQLNESCGWAQCVEGLYCNTIGDDFGESHTCLEPRKAGDPCVRNSPFQREPSVCETGLECMHVDDMRTDARCAARRELGESCDGSTAVCRPGARCEGSVCVASESRGLYQATCF